MATDDARETIKDMISLNGDVVARLEGTGRYDAAADLRAAWVEHAYPALRRVERDDAAWRALAVGRAWSGGWVDGRGGW